MKRDVNYHHRQIIFPPIFYSPWEELVGGQAQHSSIFEAVSTRNVPTLERGYPQRGITAFSLFAIPRAFLTATRKRKRNRGERSARRRRKIRRPPGSLVILLSTLLHAAICVPLCIVAWYILSLYERWRPSSCF